MSRIILFGSGSAVKDFLSIAPAQIEIVALMDNNVARHGTVIDGHEVISPDRVMEFAIDYVVIAARAVDVIRSELVGYGFPADKIVAYYPSFSQTLHDAANRDVRILNEKLFLSIPPLGLATMYLDLAGTREAADQLPRDFVRDQAFRLAARQIADMGVKGAVAELGVWQGDQARLLNDLFPDRPLYLFDTFSGFAEQDLGPEAGRQFSSSVVGDFANTSIPLVMSKMPHPGNVHIVQGFFPATTLGIDARFAFVSLDVDLHDPILAGLEWFYDRLSHGGYIFVHDYNNRRYQGVRAAVDQFVRSRQACCVPLPDFAGSVVITR